MTPTPPGSNGTLRVLGVCEPSGNKREETLFIQNRQPDTVISIFNSPFGPDVLVVTDKLSEGIDLHRYCRHLIHYELDPSPIRTVQRNGRLRRVNSWAAATGRPILYAYPAFSCLPLCRIHLFIPDEGAPSKRCHVFRKRSGTRSRRGRQLAAR